MTQVEAPVQEPAAQGPKDEFALVCYLPGALGGYLDCLRTELVPDCTARSHVTLLPPRPLFGQRNSALSQLQGALPLCPTFVVELGEVSVFEQTKVIYLEVLRGKEHLERIHSLLNQNSLHYNEPYEYHPHVTLAQGPTVFEDAGRKLQLAKDRWEQFKLPRTFVVDTVMFVQNGGCQGWLDLNELGIGA